MEMRVEFKFHGPTLYYHVANSPESTCRVVPDYVKFYTHMALYGFMTSISVNNLLLHGLIFSHW